MSIVLIPSLAALHKPCAVGIEINDPNVGWTRSASLWVNITFIFMQNLFRVNLIWVPRNIISKINTIFL